MVRDRSVSAKVFEAVVHIVMICVVLLTLLPVIHVISISFSNAAARCSSWIICIIPHAIRKEHSRGSMVCIWVF